MSCGDSIGDCGSCSVCQYGWHASWSGTAWTKTLESSTCVSSCTPQPWSPYRYDPTNMYCVVCGELCNSSGNCTAPVTPPDPPTPSPVPCVDCSGTQGNITWRNQTDGLSGTLSYISFTPATGGNPCMWLWTGSVQWKTQATPPVVVTTPVQLTVAYSPGTPGSLWSSFNYLGGIDIGTNTTDLIWCVNSLFTGKSIYENCFEIPSTFLFIYGTP